MVDETSVVNASVLKSCGVDATILEAAVVVAAIKVGWFDAPVEVVVEVRAVTASVNDASVVLEAAATEEAAAIDVTILVEGFTDVDVKAVTVLAADASGVDVGAFEDTVVDTAVLEAVAVDSV